MDQATPSPPCNSFPLQVQQGSLLLEVSPQGWPLRTAECLPPQEKELHVLRWPRGPSLMATPGLVVATRELFSGRGKSLQAIKIILLMQPPCFWCWVF